MYKANRTDTYGMLQNSVFHLGKYAFYGIALTNCYESLPAFTEYLQSLHEPDNSHIYRRRLFQKIDAECVQ